jgi:hypothetical protein
MEVFKPKTAEEWNALIQGTSHPYVKSLIIEARAKDTSESKDIIEGAKPIKSECAKPGVEGAQPLALPVEQGEFEDNEDYFNRIASFYNEGKRGKQDPTIEYAFDRVIERTLRQSFPEELNQLSDPATRSHYKLQYY